MNGITVIDDVLPDALASHMREMALGAEYPEHGVQHEGATYPGMSLTMGTEVEELMLPLVARAAGLQKATSNVSFFRCMSKGVSTGHGSEFRVHYDSTFGEYAFVLHLSMSPFAEGGTAFWRHSKLGFNEATDSNSALIGMEAHDRDAWDIDALVSVRFNRGVIYPASRIHSALPNEGWGQERGESRIIWTCLFGGEVCRHNHPI